MADNCKLNYLLTGSTLLGLPLFLYLLFFTATIKFESLGPFFLMGIMASFVLYADFLLGQRGWRTYAMIPLTSLLAFSVLELSFHSTFQFYFILILLLWLLGCLHFILRTLCPSKKQSFVIHSFCVYLSLPLFIVITQYFLLYSGKKHPLVQDEFLMAVDGTLGIYPSLLIGRFIRALPQGLRDVFSFLYLALPLAFIWIYTKRQALEKKPPFDLIIEFILIGIVGYTLYPLIPGCGTQFAFYGTWPDSLPWQFLQEGPRWVHCTTSFPRNCLPSLHMAWIVCLLRHAWFTPITKSPMLILALGTLISMFGIGAHYFVDLIVGFAFANCIGGLCAFRLSWQNTARWQALLFGGLLCLAWYIIIIYGIPFLQLSKILSWSVFLASILLSVRLENQLLLAYSRSKQASFSQDYLQIA